MSRYLFVTIDHYFDTPSRAANDIVENGVVRVCSKMLTTDASTERYASDCAVDGNPSYACAHPHSRFRT